MAFDKKKLAWKGNGKEYKSLYEYIKENDSESVSYREISEYLSAAVETKDWAMVKDFIKANNFVKDL